MKHLIAYAVLLLLLLSCAGASHTYGAIPVGPPSPSDGANKISIDAGSAKRAASTPGKIGPTSMITFVFDDGYDTDYLVARAIFAQEGAVACSAITTDWINKPEYLTTAQIRGLSEAGWEIMSHTASHPNLKSLSSSAIDGELSHSKAALIALGLNVKNLVYPYNKSNEMVREIASKYYRSGRGGRNELNHGVENPFDLRSVSNRSHDAREMKGYIDRAYVEKSWLIIYHHQIDAKATLTDKRGSFHKGEQLLFSPSGAQGRHRRDVWFLTAGSLHFIPLAGLPQPGDRVTGTVSGSSARINRMVYDQRTDIAELIRYIHALYPDMRIVTIDQGLDIMGVPDLSPAMLSRTADGSKRFLSTGYAERHAR
jgi:peptidoglycan/xylan/chitin deacetylase (PgdA/CDA1 family)